MAQLKIRDYTPVLQIKCACDSDIRNCRRLPCCVGVVSTLVAVPDGFAVGTGRDASWPGRPHAQRGEQSRCRFLSHRYVL